MEKEEAKAKETKEAEKEHAGIAAKLATELLNAGRRETAKAKAYQEKDHMEILAKEQEKDPTAILAKVDTKEKV